jgi:hypothetical protein
MTVRNCATDIRTRSASERSRRGRLLALRVLIGAGDWRTVI